MGYALGMGDVVGDSCTQCDGILITKHHECMCDDPRWSSSKRLTFFIQTASRWSP